MVEFNIRETGNDILSMLNDEFGGTSVCTLSVDVLIPDILVGDKKGLHNSILTICRYLSRNITHLIVDIELLRLRQNAEAIQLNIEIRGAGLMHRSSDPTVRLSKHQIDRFLESLPYPTTYIKSDRLIRFFFRMSFQLKRSQSDAAFQKDRLILLAEDSDVNALVFISFTEEWGWVVKRVTNGQLAIEAAQRSKFDIVFIDVHMPGMSGIEVIKRIREIESLVPIVALATTSMIHSFSLAKEAGADRILTKPIDGYELHRTLTHYFSLS